VIVQRSEKLEVIRKIDKVFLKREIVRFSPEYSYPNQRFGSHSVTVEKQSRNRKIAQWLRNLTMQL